MTATVAIGTPGYMPAEQAQGRPRANSDIYALGVIGIQALTGLYPTQLRVDHNTEEILWQHQAQVSDRLAAILSKMVRYDCRKDRYQSAGEVLQALQPLTNSFASTQPVVGYIYPSTQEKNHPNYSPIPSRTPAQATASSAPSQQVVPDRLNKTLNAIPLIFSLGTIGVFLILYVLGYFGVYFGANSVTVLGIALSVAAIGLFSLPYVYPSIARNYDRLFGGMSLICGLSLVLQGWRVDPILQFGQFLLVGAAILSVTECIRLRGGK